ncbi:MAG: FHA domain-containing protein [Anaerolineales bacterium]
MTKAVLINWNDPATSDALEQWVNLPVAIGRTDDNDITLTSSAVSRNHARIEADDAGNLRLLDLKSTNGTFLNGKKATENPLKVGDIVRIGPFNISVVGTSRGVATEAPADDVAAMSTSATMIGGAVTRQVRASDIEDMLAEAEANYQPANDNDRTIIGEMTPPLPSRNASTLQISDTEMAEIIAQEASLSDRAASNPAVIHIDDLASGPKDAQQALPDFFFSDDVVAISDLQRENVAVDETTYLTIGGGVGSFIWADYLRIFGVPAQDIMSIGYEPDPLARYKRLCVNSQIPAHERLRSDSGSTPDNIWGWPGYAVREIATELPKGKLGLVARIAWKIFSEPVLANSYTPISGRVFDSVDREAARIGWDRISKHGRVRAIRKTNDGRYAVAYMRITGPGQEEARVAVAPYVYLAVGYPGFKLLPDLTRYREQTGDFEHIVNAYEDHKHVYENLARNGGTVLLRGRGIVASRLVQRIYEARKANPQAEIRVVHLMRSPIPQGHSYAGNQRFVENHWELQPYNWPKSAFGGDFKQLLEQSSTSMRSALLNDWGGTTTADRGDWRRIVADGLREGWYEITFGAVSEVVPAEDGRIMTQIKSRDKAVQSSIVTDYVIDATGLNADIRNNPLLRDLLDTYQLPLNVKGRLDTTETFEMRQLRNDDGRIFAGGAMAFGNAFAPVDSFFGLQYSAHRSMDALLEARAPHLKNLSFFRSTVQWLKWARGVQP